MALKAILFDFDGTIADDFPIFLKLANEHAVKRGMTPLKINEFRDNTVSEILTKLHMGWIQSTYFILRIKSEFKSQLDTISLFKGIPEIINILKKKYLIGIITSNSKSSVEQILAKHHIAVDFIIASSLLGKHHKIKRALRKNHLLSEETIYIGDEIRDIDASHKVGVKTISVTWGFNSEKSLRTHGADYIAKTPKDILKIIEKL